MSIITEQRQAEIALARLTKRVRSPFWSVITKIRRRVEQAIEQRHARSLAQAIR